MYKKSISTSILETNGMLNDVISAAKSWPLSIPAIILFDCLRSKIRPNIPQKFNNATEKIQEGIIEKTMKKPNAAKKSKNYK